MSQKCYCGWGCAVGTWEIGETTVLPHTSNQDLRTDLWCRRQQRKLEGLKKGEEGSGRNGGLFTWLPLYNIADLPMLLLSYALGAITGQPGNGIIVCRV